MTRRDEGGDCFEVALRLQAEDPSLVLCHGTVLCTVEGGTAKVGQRHWHAWCERDDEAVWPDGTITKFPLCVDKANGHDVELPRALYYKAGHIEDVTRYTREEACVEMLRSMHMGPWTEGSLDDDD